jgi:hypothetical protein
MREIGCHTSVSAVTTSISVVMVKNRISEDRADSA